MPAISVIIVNFNAGDRLARCLDCLASSSVRDFEVIIFDNASTDGSLAHPRAFAAPGAFPIKIIESKKNIGFAAANNRAARHASGEWLAFLNPDAYATPNWIENMLKAVDLYPFADAFGSLQLDANDPHRLDGAGDCCSIYGFYYRGDFQRPATEAPPDGRCFAPCAAAAFYRRTTFTKLEGFDERFFCYGEDVDLGFRLWLSGGVAVQVRDAVVHHEGSALTGRHSDFSTYHGHRNRIWLYYKNMPALLYWPCVPLRLICDIALYAQAALRGNGKAYVKAMKDGYGGLHQFREDRKKFAGSASAGKIAPAIVWSPFTAYRRKGKLTKIAAPN